MIQLPVVASSRWRDRLRTEWGRRTTGILLALLAELLLALLLLTLAPSVRRNEEVEMSVTSFDARPDLPPAPEQPETPEPGEVDEASPAEPAPTPPPATPAPSRPVETRPPPPALIPLDPAQMAAADIAPAAPRPPSTTPFGPPDRSSSRDSPRVEGAGPNGEPLYAASWYRKPYDDELRGYLSTAQGPGWGLIACRTVRDYRVEDCVALGEYPERSNIARSVLAAAWQFRVRPPVLRGQSMVGEWVRIRIDYDLAVK